MSGLLRRRGVRYCVDMRGLVEFLLARIKDDEEIGHLLQRSSLEATRPLLECSAKRRIVSEHEQACGEGADHWPTEYKAYCEGCSAAQYAEQQMTVVLRLLAMPYADRPDYRREWRI